MIPSIDVGSLPAPAQKIVQGAVPLKLQEMAARGVVPGLKPADVVALLVLLTASDQAGLRETAEKTLAALPEPVLQGALGADLPAQAVDALCRTYSERTEVLERLLAMPRLHPETVEELARTGSERVTELVAVNEDLLLKQPSIIERLYMNKRTRMSTADRLVELATRNGVELSGIPAWKEVSTAIRDELVAEPSEEPTPDDLLFEETLRLGEKLMGAPDEDTHVENEEGQEVLKAAYLPLYTRIAQMTVSQKIRCAMLGSKEERMLLIRDNNRMVSTAAVRSPMMQEDEAALVSRNRNMPDEVLRVIGSTPEFMRSYTVKRNLVENPKTPVTIATRLVSQLREADLRNLAKSKNVTGPVKDAARRHLERRKT